LRIAVTADLHYGGARGRGDEATRLLAAHLHHEPPDLLLLAGDIGTTEHFDLCLGLFDRLPGWKALVPGNHDVWVGMDDPRGDSARVYREHLPRIGAAHQFHYLDQGPLLLPSHDLAIVGSMNWYDYSWSIDRLRELVPDWEDRLATKRFSRGRHNDVNYVRWPYDDVSFTREAVATLEKHLLDALDLAARAIVVTHHPPFPTLNYPEDPILQPTMDRLLWEAFSGNRGMEELLTRHAERIPLVFCGHTHRARETTIGSMHGHNVGGDYHFKRLLLIDWPEGTVEAHVFGNPDR